MTDSAPRLKLVYSRPKAWIANATIDDTRAFVERYRRSWLTPPVPVSLWHTTQERIVRTTESDDHA